MNTTETFTTQPQLIEITKLEKSPHNVRKTLTEAGVDEMKASILAHGLMQNLVVTSAGDGTYWVIVGSRRLAALRVLQAEGKLPADYAVPCQIASDEHARELSLAENTVRLDMHPADQFEAFAELIEAGKTAAEVAARFGVDESVVVKRMKLGRVAPQLLAEYREDRISLKSLMAFTITDNHKQQLKLYKSLQDWQKNDPGHIRACLTEKMIDADSKLARFVSVDAYIAAGGTTRGDFFGDEVYLEKPALLQRLASEKLDAIRHDLEAQGWGWVDINAERDWNFVNKCGRIQPVLVDAPPELVEFKVRLDAEMDEIERMLEDTESDETLDRQEALQAKLDEAEEKLASFVDFDPQQKALAGCCVSLGQDGTPHFDKGLVRPEHKKQLAKLQQPDTGDGTTVVTEKKDGLPETLRRDLAAYRQQIAKAEIAKHPALAFDLLVFHVAQYALATRPIHDGPDVHFTQHFGTPAVNREPTAAAAAIEAIRHGLPADWLDQRTEAAQFEAFRQLADADKLAILAYCVAMTLQDKLAPADGDQPTAYDAALSLTAGDVAGYWRPTRDNYLGRVTREQLLAIGRDVLGEQWAQSRSKEKKGDLVDQLDRAFATPDKSGKTPEQAERLKHWLPARMAFGALAAEPKPAKAKKARKAA